MNDKERVFIKKSRVVLICKLFAKNWRVLIKDKEGRGDFRNFVSAIWSNGVCEFERYQDWLRERLEEQTIFEVNDPYRENMVLPQEEENE